VPVSLKESFSKRALRGTTRGSDQACEQRGRARQTDSGCLYRRFAYVCTGTHLIRSRSRRSLSSFARRPLCGEPMPICAHRARRSAPCGCGCPQTQCVYERPHASHPDGVKCMTQKPSSQVFRRARAGGRRGRQTCGMPAPTCVTGSTLGEISPFGDNRVRSPGPIGAIRGRR